jgi:hypothetical protein
MQQMLLAHLAGEGDISASLPDLLEQSMGDNPMAAQVAAALRHRQPETIESVEDIDEIGPPDEDPAVVDVLTRLYGEVEELRTRNRDLADALGACPLCWGEDRRCRRCRGRGCPGGRRPDPILFINYVQPALDRRQPHIDPPLAATQANPI